MQKGNTVKTNGEIENNLLSGFLARNRHSMSGIVLHVNASGKRFLRFVNTSISPIMLQYIVLIPSVTSSIMVFVTCIEALCACVRVGHMELHYACAAYRLLEL